MTLEAQITALLAEAEPLRCLPDEEAEAKGLPAIVDKINTLRALQANGVDVLDVAREVVVEALAEDIEAQLAPKKRGRPRKDAA